MSARNRIRTLSVLAPTLVLAACSVPTAGKPTKPSDCRPSGTSASAVAPTIRCYFRAVSELDTDTACNLLSEAVQANIARGGEGDWSGIVGPDDDTSDSAPDTCSEAMQTVLGRAKPNDVVALRFLADHVSVSDVKVSGVRADADVSAVLDGGHSSTHALRLVQESGSWRIDSNSVYETD